MSLRRLLSYLLVALLAVGGGYALGSRPPALPENAVPGAGVAPTASDDPAERLEIAIGATGALPDAGTERKLQAGTIALVVYGAHEMPIRLLIGRPTQEGVLELLYDFPFAPQSVAEGEISLVAGEYELWISPVEPGPESTLRLLVTN
jgi:hypothetical protein